MTSRLHKRPRITRASTRRSNPLKPGIAAAAVALALACVTQVRAGERPVLESAQTGESETSPLDRLKRRSPVDRWKAISRTVTESSLKKTVELVDWRAVDKTRPVVAPVPIRIGPLPEAGETTDFKNDASHTWNLDRSREWAISQEEPLPLEPQAEDSFREPVRDPRDLRRITEILPYFDYEPDPNIAAEDPCKYLCPRPDMPHCKQYGPDEEVPACPDEVQLSDAIYQGRSIPESVFTWEASNLWHNPLYFEDPSLERYGHTYPCLIQPFVSVHRFGAQLVTLPYQATIDPVCKRVYTLGWYRPGECAPKKHYVPPFNAHAGVAQAGVVTGMFFIFP